jgi:hypothetical protein
MRAQSVRSDRKGRPVFKVHQVQREIAETRGCKDRWVLREQQVQSAQRAPRARPVQPARRAQLVRKARRVSRATKEIRAGKVRPVPQDRRARWAQRA